MYMHVMYIYLYYYIGSLQAHAPEKFLLNPDNLNYRLDCNYTFPIDFDQTEPRLVPNHKE